MKPEARLSSLENDLKRWKVRGTGLLISALGVGAIGHSLGNADSHPMVLIGGVAGVAWGVYWWFMMNRVYRAIADVYEAEVEATREAPGD